ncbi:uncharacterized protein [Parasteatoda tepidariorum]|uniref:uncharacterized protein n=1 Tax=Parasteatoda tepidariorum TaxID=114398 RepID=UPI001C724D69|nr:uncharacterized protein LOC122270983 [Parasteatoda tepidariorum]
MESRKINILKWTLVSVAILSFTDSIFIPLVVYRICYQSTSTFVPSQCVNCPFLALQGYSFSCFGTTAFPRNMTPAQAQCMIQRCQDGVKQTPVYLGRKRRSEDEEAARAIEEPSTTPAAESEKNEKEMQIVGQIEVLVDSGFDDYEDGF